MCKKNLPKLLKTEGDMSKTKLNVIGSYLSQFLFDFNKLFFSGKLIIGGIWLKKISLN
jgi:hypothetical protein